MVPQSSSEPATPCVVDRGIVVNKKDMHRLLSDLTCVEYVHIIEGQVHSCGKGCIVEVFNEPNSSTLVANRGLYLNLHSFDYLELNQSPAGKAYFDLVQGDRQLRLIPLSSPMQEQLNAAINPDEIEAIFNQVIAAKWDAQIDEDVDNQI